MDLGIIANRYATSLLEVAFQQDQDTRRSIYDAMKLLRTQFQSEPMLLEAMQNPVLSSDQKKRLLVTASGTDIPTLLDRFFDTVLLHRREELIRLMTLIYLQRHRQARGIKDVLIETAAPIDADLQRQLEERLAQMLQSRVECRYRTIPQLLGGFRIRVEDKRIDASYQRKLDDLRRQLIDFND